MCSYEMTKIGMRIVEFSNVQSGQYKYFGFIMKFCCCFIRSPKSARDKNQREKSKTAYSFNFL